MKKNVFRKKDGRGGKTQKKKIKFKAMAMTSLIVASLLSQSIDVFAVSDVTGPTFSNLRIENVSESGFDMVLDVQDDISGVDMVSLAYWRSGSYNSMGASVINGAGSGTKRLRADMKNIGAGSDYVYIGVHLRDYAGNLVFRGDFPIKLDSTPPNINLSLANPGWTNGNVNIKSQLTDNFNGVEKFSIKGPGIYEEKDIFSSPKILSLSDNHYQWDSNRHKLDYFMKKGYEIHYNTNPTSISDFAGYDIILYDNGWASATDYSALLNEAYEKGYRIFTVGNDTPGGVIHPVSDAFLESGAIEYSMFQHINQNEDNVSDLYKAKDYDNLMKYFNWKTEADSSMRLITQWPSDTRPIAMNSTYQYSPSILYSINDNGGKWIHFQFYSALDSMDRRVLDELMLGTKARRLTYNEEHTVTENGTYVVEAEDFSGNRNTKSITVSNIDRVVPTATATISPSTWTNGNVTINLVAQDDKSGVRSIRLPNGNVVNSTSVAYSVPDNGKYTFQITDNAGNVSSKTVDVGNIERVAPTAVITQSPSAWTKDKVTITVNASDATSGIRYIKNPDGSIVYNSTSSYQVSANGNYTFEIADFANNITKKTINIGNIDTSNPTVSVVQSPTAWTNGKVVLTASTNDIGSGVVSIKKPDGSIINGKSTSYEATINGDYIFETTDLVGNKGSLTHRVTNIDKTAPTISLTKSTTAWTNGGVTINYNAKDGESGVKDVKLPNGVVVTTPSGVYTVNSNGTYGFEVRDVAGNSAVQTITISNIDKTVPYANITQNPTFWTNGGVTLTVSAQDLESGVKNIKKPDGTTVSGSTTTYPVTQNGSFAFVITDNAGNTTTKSITVSNIDKTLPVVTISPNITGWTNGNVVLTGSATDNASSVATLEKPDGTKIQGASATYAVSENGTYTFKATDVAGNVGTKSFTVSNIDKVAPAVSFAKNPSGWTNGTVVITATATDSTSGVKQIKLPNGTVLSKNTVDYSVTANGNYSFEIMDNAGNISTKSVTVDNIDKTVPYGNITQNPTSWTKGAVTLSITAGDNESGVKSIKKPDGTIVQSTSTTYQVSKNGVYTFEITDNVNNKTSKSITVSNIDSTAPVLTLTPEINRITNEGINIKVDGYDSQSGVKQIKLPDGKYIAGGTTTYRVDRNGTYSFEIEDNVGNKSVSSITISNIIEINPVSGIQRIEYKLEGATVKGWTSYTGAFSVENEGITVITARGYDKAGNVSNEAVSFVKLDRSKPINGTVEIIVR